MKTVSELDNICEALVKITESADSDQIVAVKMTFYLEENKLTNDELNYIMLRLQMLKNETLFKLAETEGDILLNKARKILNPSSSSIRM